MNHICLDAKKLLSSLQNDKRYSQCVTPTNADGGCSCNNFSLAECVSELCEPYRLIAETNGLRFQIEIIEDMSVRLPENQLKKALSNILSNAVNYTETERHIKLSWKNQFCQFKTSAFRCHRTNCNTYLNRSIGRIEHAIRQTAATAWGCIS